MDVRGFKPEELEVDVQGRELTIKGDHEERQDSGSRISRTFVRKYTLPEDVNMAGDEVFDPVQMQMLYDLGHRMALKEPRWLTQLPGLRPDP